ncbi:MAG: glycosyltransferase, partial [Oscillibacter sp.]|nr:glycosyltransferase [Oscillibacter sp.]
SYYREGLPRTILEAMSCGRAVITTDWPGCREPITDGENGFLVPVRDAAANTTNSTLSASGGGAGAGSSFFAPHAASASAMVSARMRASAFFIFSSFLFCWIQQTDLP